MIERCDEAVECSVSDSFSLALDSKFQRMKLKVI